MHQNWESVVRRKTPAPIRMLLRRAGDVGLLDQAQHVLHRHDGNVTGCASDKREHGFDHRFGRIRAWFVALPYHTPEMAAVFAARPALRRRIAKLRPTAEFLQPVDVAAPPPSGDRRQVVRRGQRSCLPRPA